MITYSTRRDIPLGLVKELYAAEGWSMDDIFYWPRVFEHSLCVRSAWDGDTLVGIVEGYDEGPVFLLHTLIVRQGAAYRRKGIGERLLYDALDDARSAGCDMAELGSSGEAVGFYTKRGFTPVIPGHLQLRMDLLPASDQRAVVDALLKDALIARSCHKDVARSKSAKAYRA